MAIEWIQFGNIGSIGAEAGKQTQQNEEAQGIFGSIFQDAINNVVETENAYQHEKYKLATGQTDDVHTVPIAGAKAQLSVDLLIQLRNKALDAYNEVMRINL